MKLARTLWILRIFGVCLTSSVMTMPFAALADDVAKADNPVLAELYKADQDERNVDPSKVTTLDWNAIGARDSLRLAKAHDLLRSGVVRTSHDYLRAALLFQHGESADDFRLAYSLAWIASSLDGSNKEARWLSAAAWDRLLMKLGHPQWYGTQFDKASAESKWRIDPIDESVTDEERASFGVPPLMELRKRLLEMNR